MTANSTSVRLVGIALVASIGVVLAACDGPASPTRRIPAPVPGPVTVVEPVSVPVPVPPGPPAAVLSVEEFAFDGVRAELVPRLRLAESGGRSDAVVALIAFNLADGTPWPSPMTWAPARRVSAGASAVITPGKGPYGDPDWNFSVDANYGGKVSAVIVFTDDQGRRGTASAVAAPPR